MRYAGYRYKYEIDHGIHNLVKKFEEKDIFYLKDPIACDEEELLTMESVLQFILNDSKPSKVNSSRQPSVKTENIVKSEGEIRKETISTLRSHISGFHWTNNGELSEDSLSD